jgi:hypothetical protein
MKLGITLAVPLCLASLTLCAQTPDAQTSTTTSPATPAEDAPEFLGVPIGRPLASVLPACPEDLIKGNDIHG